jgi:hypothetical protein
MTFRDWLKGPENAQAVAWVIAPQTMTSRVLRDLDGKNLCEIRFCHPRDK